MSLNEIEWATVTYTDDHGDEQTFTGYVTYLTQADTFKLNEGIAKCQLRIKISGEVGSSAISEIEIGDALSLKVLE